MLSKISESTGLTKKDCADVYNAFIDMVHEELNKEVNCSVSIPNIGVLKVSLRDAHPGKDPRTGETILCEAKRIPHMTISKRIKDAIDQECIKNYKKGTSKKKVAQRRGRKVRKK